MPKMDPDMPDPENDDREDQPYIEHSERREPQVVVFIRLSSFATDVYRIALFLPAKVELVSPQEKVLLEFYFTRGKTVEK